jgi:mannose-6-phosphate isomerase-like protein (cupin superfamily)
VSTPATIMRNDPAHRAFTAQRDMSAPDMPHVPDMFTRRPASAELFPGPRAGTARGMRPRNREVVTMATAMSVSRLETKSHDHPDEVRAPDKTRVEVVRLEGYTIGRFSFEPGWQWSECVKPVVGTESCQVSHVGYAVSGHIAIRMDDGSETRIAPGMSYTIPPGHDAWVEGNEPFVGIEVMSAEQYAKP